NPGPHDCPAAGSSHESSLAGASRSKQIDPAKRGVFGSRTMTTVLVTGGAGFIGSNFVHYIAERHPDYRIVVLDALTYAGSTDNLPEAMRQIDHPRMRFWYGDVVNAELVNTLVAEADYVVHFAAETHVTRSIFDNRLFFQTDVMGAHTVANAVLKANGRVKRFVHISSSEVYGTAEKQL